MGKIKILFICHGNEFNARMSAYAEKLQEYFVEGDKLKTEIMEQLKKVKYE